jgi:PAS domain S-box-containing protein
MSFRYFSKTILTQMAAVIALSLLVLAHALSAQSNSKHTFRVLVLYWDNKDFPGNIKFDESFQATLRSSSAGNVEYYPEYLETTRFPGQDPAFFRDYLKQKYDGRAIDVVVATADPALNFFSKYRAELFPNAPIVFVSNQPPGSDILAAGPGMTGIVHQSTHSPTLNLALNLQPDTRHVFVVSGSREHDKRFETAAREELNQFENRVEINYLTDLPLNELSSKLASLPPKSIVFYIWQQTTDDKGRLLETYEVLNRIASTSSAPIYGMGSGNLGQGIIGGYLQGPENNGAKVATMTIRILNGTRVQDMRLENAPTLAMFDWRQLKRWGINERDLPPGSIVRFREVTFWQLYKWYIVGLVGAVIVEAILIAWLLLVRVQRRQAEFESDRLARVAEAERQRLDEIVSNVPGIVWETRIDPSTRQRKTTYISDYVKKMLGYTPDEWLTAPPGLGLRIVPEEQREKVRQESDAVVATGVDGVSQFRWEAKDGSIHWVENYLSPIKDPNNGVIGLRGVALDVTARKLAEENVRQSEQKNKAILNAIPDLMFLQTREGVYLDLHYSDPTKLVVAPNEYLGKNMRDILPADLAEKFTHYFQRTIDTGETQIVEYELTLNGERRWYESRLLCCGEDILSVVRDITERREAELALSESEGRLRLAQNAARMGTWEWHLATGESIWSDMIWELLGLEPGDRPVHVNDFVELVHPDDRERAWNKVSQVISEGEDYYDEFRILRKDGRVVWLSSQGRLFRTADGMPERMIGVNVDISRRKFAEETALETQQKDIAILNAIPDLMFLQTRDGVYLDYHAKNSKDLLISPDQFIGKNMREVLPPELSEKLAGCFQRVGNGNSLQVLEYQLPIEGTERWYEARLVASGENILSVVRDITARKDAEAEILASEERFAKAFRANPQPMSITTLEEGLYIDVNDSFLAMSGYTREEVIGRTSLELDVWGDPGTRADFIRRLKQQGSLVNTETVFHGKNGRISTLLSSAEFLEIDGKNYLLVASSDVTERVKAQKALRESEARFRNMADTAPVMIWVSDKDRLCTYFNQQGLDLTGLTMEQASGFGWADCVHPEDRERCLTIYNSNFDARRPFQMEYRLRRADGIYRWVISSGTPRFSADGEFLGYIGTGVDITERRESEEELRSAHEEVSLLKNQLQQENIYLKEEISLSHDFGEIIGQSDALKYVLFKIEQVAPTEATVLITGETGTGKELVARAIHKGSNRSERPLVRVNCGALSSSLIESELFGHEKGAFTGATAR